ITTPAAEPYLAHQGEARWYGDSLFEFLIPDEATGGRLTFFRATLAQGFSPPRHVHTREDEVFHVLEGEVTFDIDGELRAAGPGRRPAAAAHPIRAMPVRAAGIRSADSDERQRHGTPPPPRRRARRAAFPDAREARVDRRRLLDRGRLRRQAVQGRRQGDAD